MHDSDDTRRFDLPQGDSWEVELVDPGPGQLRAALLSGAIALACLGLAARRAQLSSPNEWLTVVFGAGLALVALAALSRWRFTRAHAPLCLRADPERVTLPHLGWRTSLVTLPWSELTGVGVRQSGGRAHSVALVTSSRTYVLPAELLPPDTTLLQVAGTLEHLRALHSN